MRIDNINTPLLPPSTGTWTTELLRLHATRISNEEGTIVGDKRLLQADSLCGILVLGIVRNKGLGDGLSDSVYLGDVATTLDAHTDVDAREGFLANDQDRLVDLVPEDFGLDEADGGAVDTDETAALTRVGDGGGGLSDRM